MLEKLLYNIKITYKVHKAPTVPVKVAAIVLAALDVGASVAVGRAGAVVEDAVDGAVGDIEELFVIGVLLVGESLPVF